MALTVHSKTMNNEQSPVSTTHARARDENPEDACAAVRLFCTLQNQYPIIKFISSVLKS